MKKLNLVGMISMVLICVICFAKADGEIRKVGLRLKYLQCQGLDKMGSIFKIHNDEDKIRIYGKAIAGTINTLDLDGPLVLAKEKAWYYNYVHLKNLGLEFFFPDGGVEMRLDKVLHTTLERKFSGDRPLNVELVGDSLYYRSSGATASQTQIVRYSVAGLLSGRQTAPEILQDGVSVFIWTPSAGGSLFVAFSNLEVSWGTVKTSFSQFSVREWKAAVEVGENVLLSGYNRAENYNQLLLLDSELKVISEARIKCSLSALSTDLGNVRTFSRPISVKGESFVLCACEQSEVSLIAVYDRKIHVDLNSLDLDLKKYQYKDINTITNGVDNDSWFVAGHQWIAQVFLDGL